MSDWYGLYDPNTGELASIGTVAMFAGRERPQGARYQDFSIVGFGSARPDLSKVMWDGVTRTLVPRPPEPVPPSEIDLLMQRLGLQAEWLALNANQRRNIEAAIRRAGFPNA